MSSTVKVAVIGASGYTGLELLKILAVHPRFEIVYVGTSEGGEAVTALHPALQNVISGKAEKSSASEVAKVAELAFLALPHQASMGFAKELLALGVKVVDLSADYRLTQAVYEQHYCPHEDAANLGQAVYGLPELYRQELKTTALVANPGCYPTATLLALVPFLPYLVPETPVMVDAKSGISGAGKKPNPVTQFVNLNDNMMAYNPLSHRHEPEIKEQLLKRSGRDVSVFFVPQLIPVTRGMLVNVYAQLSSSIAPLEVLEAFYANEPFVRIRKEPVTLKATAGTHFCDIFAKEKEGVLFLSASIDNLLRGASSQAVVNANIMCGFEEYMGIPTLSYVP
jgi:N-acetyl-gamma-glutamyl-phosphate reductase